MVDGAELAHVDRAGDERAGEHGTAQERQAALLPENGASHLRTAADATTTGSLQVEQNVVRAEATLELDNRAGAHGEHTRHLDDHGGVGGTGQDEPRANPQPELVDGEYRAPDPTLTVREAPRRSRTEPSARSGARVPTVAARDDTEDIALSQRDIWS